MAGLKKKAPTEVEAFFLERVTGIEPVSRPWQGRIIPVYYTRKQPEAGIFNLPIFNQYFNS